ncbi:uncharacterized protein PV07_08657 [Cladophialophora immunda]|uniref:Uncharacterized protein n=1 Tax=Cladophialophora immunda TaxID=569365 RepID=A0A0D1ZCN8_9EURO|nr:uncharacterized protein PV07_08657 [Cladophialophora immunda]KIW25491.1 hypothetical protein PV07_08657 [Cladophialophora immunda]
MRNFLGGALDAHNTPVKHQHMGATLSSRKSGVGRCLMDALLDATDRGYLKKGRHEFRVALEVRHLYSTGGGRDLHELIFQVRSFNRPMSPQLLDRIRGAAQGQAPQPSFPLKLQRLAAAIVRGSNPSACNVQERRGLSRGRRRRWARCSGRNAVSLGCQQQQK